MATSEDAPGRSTASPDRDLPEHNLPRSARAMWELLAAACVGTLVGVLVTAATPVTAVYGTLLGYDVAAVAYLGAVWTASWRLDANGTAAAALREDPTRTVARVILIDASVASLAAVLYTVAEAGRSTGSAEILLVLLGVASIVVSWFVVHTLFVLRYAREFYIDEDGGIEFHMTSSPVWSDFAYVAFTIGMCFQVADTDLGTSRMRRVALRHQLLSYVFGTVIIGVTINLIAGLTH